MSLGLFPTALVACASAWESALKAAFAIPESDRATLENLITRADSHVQGLVNWRPNSIIEFRQKRNHITHYGYTPRDDDSCARLLLDAGLPGLCAIYQTFFGYHLMWQLIPNAREAYLGSHAEHGFNIGILPEFGDLLWFGLSLFTSHNAHTHHPTAPSELESGPATSATQSPSKINLEATWFLQPIASYIRWRLKDSWTSSAEHLASERIEATGARDFHLKDVRDTIALQLGDRCAELDCPICQEPRSLVASISASSDTSAPTQVAQCVCPNCHFHLPTEAGLIATAILRDQLHDLESKWI